MIVDASVWVSYFVSTDVYRPATVPWLDHVLAEGRTLYAPTLMPVEVAAAVVQVTGNPVLARTVETELFGIQSLRLVPLDADLIHLAMESAIFARLKGADAVYLATARAYDVPLVTWDKEQRARGAAFHEVHTPAELA